MKISNQFTGGLMILLLALGLAHAASAETASAEVASTAKDVLVGGNGGLHSLRGQTEVKDTYPGESWKKYPKDGKPIDSDYVYQPPLIPHTIRNYEVSLNANKCLSCHSWKYANEMGATKISVTHYRSPRQGQVLSDVSPSRYFCLQCHVPQADATPLVENTFKRVDALEEK